MKYMQFTLGPVQGFVSQARRTNDYWSGSFLLSYLTAKAMMAVIENKNRIIFPMVQNADGTPADPLLNAIKGSMNHDHIYFVSKAGSIPNRFLAEVNDNFSADTCKDAVNLAWQELAHKIWQRYIDNIAVSLGNGSYDIWQRQINNFWEMTWVIGEKPDLLDRRKNWRLHIPPDEPGDKCSLMGNWQELSGYVGITEREQQAKFWQALSNRIPGYNLQPDERLCSIALVKRLFPLMLKGNKVPYPSTPYLAAIPWLSAVIKDQQEQALAREFAAIASNKLIRTPYTFNYDHLEQNLAKFVSLDGNCFFQSTLENKNLWDEWKDDNEVQASLDKLKDIIKVFKTKPSPFYALLIMDGDRIGELLNDTNNRTRISKAISSFSGAVEDTISRHKGVTVYAGGDDVVALLPMDQALGAAEALYRKYFNSFQQLNIQATISAAIVYAHHHAPLKQIITKAHQVLDEEAKEKTGRDAIAVSVWKTGGEVINWSTPWDVIDSDGSVTPICDVINQLTAELRQGYITNSWIYGIRKLLGNPRGNQFTVPDGMDAIQVTRLLTAQLMDSREIDTDTTKAESIIRYLQTLCVHQYRDREGRIIRDDGQFSLDGALFIKFLVTKGVI